MQNMTAKDVIDVLQIIKRKELKSSIKINKLCTNPSESIGAKAIDEAIRCIEALGVETKRTKALEAAIKHESLNTASDYFAACGSCVNNGPCYENFAACLHATLKDCERFSRWEFDYARFADGGGKCDKA